MVKEKEIRSHFLLLCICWATDIPGLVNGQHTKMQMIGDSVEKITQHRFEMDASTPLPSRIQDASDNILKTFREAGLQPTRHTLTKAEIAKVEKALQNLPPLYRKVLQAHLQSISFLDSMPNTALTSSLNYGDPFQLYNITIRAAVLQQNASEWATAKENLLYIDSPAAYYISIDAGQADAIEYVLLHEATHILDGVLGLTPDKKKGGGMIPFQNAFIKDAWKDRTTILAKYKSPLFKTISFRYGGLKMPASESVKLYHALAKTPFSTVYGTCYSMQ